MMPSMMFGVPLIRTIAATDHGPLLSTGPAAVTGELRAR